jgi:membrane fusion protein (multidrug efflux system)
MKPSLAVSRFATFALVCVALVTASCGKEGAAPAKAPDPLTVSAMRMELQRVPVSVDTVGQAEGSREVEIRARVSGILEKRIYTEGAPVKAGQTLFAIDRAQYEIAAAQAQAALSQEKARQEQARREAERMKPLAGNRAISQREYEEAVSTFKQSSAAIEGAEAKIAEAKLNLSYTNVTAPISGIASRAIRSEGSLVNANTDLLTTLTQVNPIWVRFSLAESDFERIRGKNKSVRVNILNRDGSVAAGNGKINFLGSTVDAKLGTVQIRAEFPNADMQWLPGQFLKVQILAGEQEAFLVPQVAVTQTEQGYLVWLAEGGKANSRVVKTANWVGSNWIVTAGLKAGDTVIVDNLMKLRPGTAVTPREAGTAPAAATTDSANKPAAAR